MSGSTGTDMTTNSGTVAIPMDFSIGINIDVSTPNGLEAGILLVKGNVFTLKEKRKSLTLEQFNAEVDREVLNLDKIAKSFHKLNVEHKAEKRELQNLRTEVTELKIREEESEEKIQLLKINVQSLEDRQQRKEELVVLFDLYSLYRDQIAAPTVKKRYDKLWDDISGEVKRKLRSIKWSNPDKKEALQKELNNEVARYNDALGMTLKGLNLADLISNVVERNHTFHSNIPEDNEEKEAFFQHYEGLTFVSDFKPMVTHMILELRAKATDEKAASS